MNKLSETLNAKDRCQNCMRKTEILDTGYCPLCDKSGTRQRFGLRIMFQGFYESEIQEALWQDRFAMIKKMEKVDPDAARELCKDIL